MLNLLSKDALQLRGHGDAGRLDRLVHELSDVRLLDILAWEGRRNAQI